MASDFQKLPEAATDEAKRIAVIVDFDGGSCYPSPAISIHGEINGGLKPTGDETRECQNAEQLDNSNTYSREREISKGGKTFAVHMYALYFQKDQWVPVSPLEIGGHRHDREYVL